MGVLIVRIIIFGGLYWGSPILGKCHLSFQALYFVDYCLGVKSVTVVTKPYDLLCTHDFTATQSFDAG